LRQHNSEGQEDQLGALGLAVSYVPLHLRQTPVSS
jgi:hypothetical protein